MRPLLLFLTRPYTSTHPNPSVLHMELRDFITTPGGGTIVRISRSQIRARVKRDTPIVFSSERISAHGGLELASSCCTARVEIENGRESGDSRPNSTVLVTAPLRAAA